MCENVCEQEYNPVGPGLIISIPENTGVTVIGQVYIQWLLGCEGYVDVLSQGDPTGTLSKTPICRKRGDGVQEFRGSEEMALLVNI